MISPGQKARWWLGNAEERESKTYQIPSLAERRSLHPGSLAKLSFEFTPLEENDNCAGERMWVLVKSVTQTPDGPRYLAELNNDPFFLEDVLKCGDEIAFEAKHVIGIDEVET